MSFNTIKKANVRPAKALLLKIAKELDAGKHDNFYAPSLSEQRQKLDAYNVLLAAFRVAPNSWYHELLSEPREFQVLFVLMARAALTDVYDVVPN